ncbi:unnamed protein product [Protopolystoma xenopodis]|uniref:Uncharacterized protein n=1 Tax=Protopolystoma xenopodis TaxID=117903 RepID=A0A3S5A273_9PLAT|nr:unnamed protein product [Protopolystoma xenopodis]
MLVCASSAYASFVYSLLQKNELMEMLQLSAQLELTYAHLWDYTLVNDDLPVALEQLSELAYRQETEAAWVPQKWLSTRSDNSSPSSQGSVESRLKTASVAASLSDEGAIFLPNSALLGGSFSRMRSTFASRLSLLTDSATKSSASCSAASSPLHSVRHNRA